MKASAVSTKQIKHANAPRIVTLSPHLAELVYELGMHQHLIAVSDYSDYPKELLELPKIASYQGADIAAIARLEPSHVLVWRNGNKAADIARLEQLNTSIFYSSIDSPQSLIEEIMKLGDFLAAPKNAQALVKRLNESIDDLARLETQKVDAVYYLSTTPLVGLGNDKWLNQLLSLCRIDNVFKNASSAYPQLSLAEILRLQPPLIIAADGRPLAFHQQYWQQHEAQLKSTLLIVNPDAMHRFTPRAVFETSKLCMKINSRK